MGVQSLRSEAVLRGAALLIECEESSADGERLRALQGFVEALPGPLLIFSRDPLALGGRGSLRLDLPAPSPAEQRRLWELALGSLAAVFLRGLTARGAPPTSGTRLFARLSLFHVGAFVAMEVLERVTSGAPLDGLLRDGLLPVGPLVQVGVAPGAPWPLPGWTLSWAAPRALDGFAGRTATTFNDIGTRNQRMAGQLERVGEVVGKEGKTRQRVRFGPLTGAWLDMEHPFEGRFVLIRREAGGFVGFD